ncbi:hypothetical protein SteCoe_6038 [Stentor coeruleus]|uniref:Uncharacterized protein n=1 Tax=Stentor coeruleus TaxID=5963 RepID=A0A1R2CR19_9CILI|nr:hypothetical protein SteCoe_6038 [Stentor coeruleus]
MCVFDNPPTPCDEKCGHIKYSADLDKMLGVMENMPPLPCADPNDVSVEELLSINDQLSKKIQQQNRVIEETLGKIQEAIRNHK